MCFRCGFSLIVCLRRQHHVGQMADSETGRMRRVAQGGSNYRLSLHSVLRAVGVFFYFSYIMYLYHHLVPSSLCFQ